MILPRLQFITSDSAQTPLLEQAHQALSLGVRWIQVRSKDLGDVELTTAVREIIRIARPYSAIVTVNDRADVAANCNSDGVHVGRDDTPPAEAAFMLRPGSIIGGSINSLDDIEYYSTSGVAYCGIGPLRSSSTKSNLRTHLGADRIVELARVLTSKMGIPGYAVGGVTVDDIAPLLSRGVYGVAVSAAIHSKSRVEVQRLLDVVQSFEAQGLSTAFDKELSAS